MKLQILLSLVLAGISACVVGQSKYEALKVGSKIPDYELTNLINYPKRNENVTAFRGKLLIFDLWSTYCPSCIESWPKLIKLQEEFDGKIQIILLNTTQNESTISKVLKKQKETRNLKMTLPIICGDTVLGNQLFMHEGVPHVVWVDAGGNILSITHSDVLNAKNIQAFLDKKNLTLPQKGFVSTNIDTRNNTLPSATSKVIWQSSLTKYNPDYIMTHQIYADSLSGYSIYMAGSIDMLYQYAYSNTRDESALHLQINPLNRTVYELNNLSRISFKVNGEIQWDNLFVYQLKSGKQATERELLSMMQSDLQRYFDLYVRWEKRTLECLVLTVADTSANPYREGRYNHNITDTGADLNGISVAELIYRLNEMLSYNFYPNPIIDETNFKGRFGKFSFRADVKNPDALGKALAKHGIFLKRQVKDINMLIFSDPHSDFKIP